jgi:hypothetical protein
VSPRVRKLLFRSRDTFVLRMFVLRMRTDPTCD